MSTGHTSHGIAEQAAGAPRPLAVVTGASSGIGLELARVLARERFDLVVAAEDERIEAIAQDLQRLGTHARAVQVDLATVAGCERLVDEVRGLGRPVDALVLNAGVGVGGEFARDNELQDHLRLVDLNVRHPVHVARELLPDMVQRGAGRILFTSSIAAAAPGPYQATYAASKAFVHFFAEGIRVELQDSGVTVTALQPGPTDTAFFARAGMEDTKLAQGRKDDPAQVAREGFDAMMRGDDHVVAGAPQNTAQALGGKLLPETLTARMQARQTKPGSGE
ncbi:SDR family NAD(P)-dependent oxidoreductase [Patulibacter sp. SYSU D01012]|uniref:SDR family NAD(P)-dependent oxidoreductase n=1 Tax=Patulibacter sp. SYSU D01012 TaxID=2817381 RepID=UPI001B30D566|nr:SDR family NAD(P)-dependent oxidoreductase [Patulibacter sp. SYSU D01012]